MARQGRGIILSEEDLVALVVAAHRKLDAATLVLNQLAQHFVRGDLSARKVAGPVTLAEALETARQLLERATADLSEIAEIRQEPLILSQTDDEIPDNGQV